MLLSFPWLKSETEIYAINEFDEVRVHILKLGEISNYS